MESKQSHQSENELSKTKMVAKDYTPSHSDVIIGRGKKCYNHAGNKQLQKIVESRLREYSACTDKLGKSRILSFIVAQIRRDGKFVKYDHATGRWIDAGEQTTREKVAQMFRDSLHEKYRSSTAFKAKKRRLLSKIQCLSRNSDCAVAKPYPSGLDATFQKHVKSSQNTSVQDCEQPSESSDALSRLLSSTLPCCIYEDGNPFEPVPISPAIEIRRRCKSDASSDGGVVKENPKWNSSEKGNLLSSRDSNLRRQSSKEGVSQGLDNLPTSNIQMAKTA